MERQHLLLIGGGPNQLSAIQAATSRGLRLSVLDGDRDALGRGHADHFANVSTRDVKAAVAFASDLNDQFKIHGVMTMASESAVTVAAIAQELALPGVSVEAALRATHKGLRHEAFQHAGVPSPRFMRVKNLVQAQEALESLGVPVVVKPVDGAGSRGVQKINTGTELPAAVAEIFAISKVREILIEEFLIGSEHSIEGLVVAGAVRWTGFSDRNYALKEVAFPYFVEDGDTMPSLLTPSAKSAVEQAATNAVKALGIKWGPVKGDILVNESGPKVIEMAARLSGDFFCDVTSPLHNGIELVPAVMDMCLGLPLAGEALSPKFSRGVALRGLWGRNGVVADIEGIDELYQFPGVSLARLEPKWQRESLPKRATRRDRLAVVVTTADTRDEATYRAKVAINSLRIVSQI